VVESEEYCRRCGSVIYDFSKKKSASDGLDYCIKCAEHLDTRHLIANTCSACARSFGKGEVKFVMPSKIYSTSPMPLEKRLMCVGCYRHFAVRNRVRARINGIRQFRLGFRRSFARGIPSVARIRN